MTCGYISSYNPSAGVGFISPEDPQASGSPDAVVKASKSPQERAADGDLLLFHEADRLNPASWMPEVGLPVSYERTDRTEDVYQVVEKVAPMQPDVPDAAHAPPGSVVLEADDPASQAAY